MRANSPAASLVWPTPSVVIAAAAATPPIVVAIAPLPVAASDTLRFISAVVALCSATAEAIVVWKLSIRPMIAVISPIAAVAPEASCWMASTRRAMSPVALGGCLLRAGRDGLRGPGQLVGRRGQCLRRLRRGPDHGLQVLGGLVERPGHVADLIAGGDSHPDSEVSRGHGRQPVAHGGYRPDHEPSHQQAEAE